MLREEIVKHALYKLKSIVICPKCEMSEIQIETEAELGEDGKTLELPCFCLECKSEFVYIYRIKRIEIHRV